MLDLVLVTRVNETWFLGFKLKQKGSDMEQGRNWNHLWHFGIAKGLAQFSLFRCCQRRNKRFHGGGPWSALLLVLLLLSTTTITTLLLLLYDYSSSCYCTTTMTTTTTTNTSTPPKIGGLRPWYQGESCTTTFRSAMAKSRCAMVVTAFKAQIGLLFVDNIDGWKFGKFSFHSNIPSWFRGLLGWNQPCFFQGGIFK